MNEILAHWLVDQVAQRMIDEPENPMGEGPGGYFLDAIRDDLPTYEPFLDELDKVIPMTLSPFFADHEERCANAAQRLAGSLALYIAATAVVWHEDRTAETGHSKAVGWLLAALPEHVLPEVLTSIENEVGVFLKDDAERLIAIANEIKANR